ncbi:DUF4113 domain-containing protein, partial [Escherichia coli]
GRQQPVGCWSMKRELLTPAYTTSWCGLAKAGCQVPSH